MHTDRTCKRAIIGIVICAIAVAAFQYVAVVLSLADFHPGGDADIPAHLATKAKIGSSMMMPFDALRGMIIDVIGRPKNPGYVQWIVLPVAFGTLIYFFGLALRRSIMRLSNPAG